MKILNLHLKSGLLDNAVVGIVDMVGSVRISNAIGPAHEFELKKEFLRVATIRARQYRIQILNHTGDGFLFLANQEGAGAWKRDLMSFYVALTSDFAQILSDMNAATGWKIASGLRFGISYGSVMMGCLGGNPIHYTAVGTDVNLASRLCAKAESGEMVFSASAWKAMGETFSRVNKKIQFYDLKGFEDKMVGVHIHRSRLFTENRAVSNRGIAA